jgi:hypothetical protein
MKNQVTSAPIPPYNVSESYVDEGYNDASDGSKWQKGETKVSYMTEARPLMDV